MILAVYKSDDIELWKQYIEYVPVEGSEVRFCIATADEKGNTKRKYFDYAVHRVLWVNEKVKTQTTLGERVNMRDVEVEIILNDYNKNNFKNWWV